VSEEASVAGPSVANLLFLPWVRQGAASDIKAPDSLEPGQAAAVSVPVTLLVNGSPEVTRHVRLYGPGDVTGIDPQQVVRTEPRHLATDFEPNYFPAVDFDRPDFPWLFTPASAGGSGKLRPWVCLVVVQKQRGVTLRSDPALPLPVLDIDTPAHPDRELPDLAESWAWAHAQIAGTPRDAASIQRALGGNPALTTSRLLCPRRLDPNAEYLACVVPAFEVGRRTGLGLSTRTDEEQGLAPAWTSGPGALSRVTLPVYFHWEFRTGSGGDFETLAAALEAREWRDMPGIGTRPIVVGGAGLDVSPRLPPDTVLELEGALKLPDSPVAPWPDETRVPFQAALETVLNTPARAVLAGDVDPVVAPPIYGRWHAARNTVHAAASPQITRTWLDELNLDPRHRAVAAIGTAVVQAHQEPLMASAWEQMGEIERINRMQRQSQLGRAVNAVYHARHFSRLSEEALLKVVATAQSRVVLNVPDAGSGTTPVLLSHRLAQSAVPATALSAPLRRLTSRRSVISTRFGRAGSAPMALVTTLDATVIVGPRKIDAGLMTLDLVSTQPTVPDPQIQNAVRFQHASRALDTTPPLGDFTIAAEGLEPRRSLLSFAAGTELPDNPAAEAFRKAAKAHHRYLEEVFTSPIVSRPANPINVGRGDLKGMLLQTLDPAKTFRSRAGASLQRGDGIDPVADPLEPILDAPEFPQPMYEAVREISQEFLLPGLQHVPPNTVAILETNPRFIEAFMAGLNFEMARELLWRNYPTDQRGTYFRQFWDSSAGGQSLDIAGIHEWGDSALGDNASTGEKLVLLIRGELLRRYPNSVIYAVAAVDAGADVERTLSGVEKHPLFRGTLEPDVTFLGFDLTQTEAVAGAGWYFVIQQQPTEPRFGLDVADFTTPPQPPALITWNDLSWRHLADTENELKSLSHASVRSVLPRLDDAEWNRNAAHQAYITLQRPVRIAIHASKML
jgi:hypothetical protein